MWNTIKNLAEKHIKKSDQFGQRMALAMIALGLFEGLSMVSDSLDRVAEAINNHRGS